MTIRISIPPSPAHSSPPSSAGPSSTDTASSRTNTVVIASLPPAFFEHTVLEALRLHFASYGDIHTWAPLKAFARIMLVYYDEDAAEKAKLTCDGIQIDETEFKCVMRSPLLPIYSNVLPVMYSPSVTLRVFRADPTPLDQLENPDLLRPPVNEKNFLISPPGSPPVGWEPIHEDPPNSTPLADDLIAALRKLQIEREGKGGIEVLIKPEDGTGIGVYVEDCDEGSEREDFGEIEECPYGQIPTSILRAKPIPTAMPPLPGGG